MSLRERAEAAGLPPMTLAAMLDAAPSIVYRELDGARPQGRVRAVLTAWEVMTPQQRMTWLAALGVAAERPRRGRPRKSGATAAAPPR
ncbi:MAG TPA: hypothetical protein VFA12_20400 [Stellaceae bacterium]|nr:hypothetical protein [Stellaceae bacterium]